MLNMFGSNLRLRTLDLAKKLKVHRYYSFYKSTLMWSRRQIEEYQLRKLKELVEHAYRKVPYYKDLFEEISFTPDCITTLSDIRRIPYLTRENIQTQHNNLISTGIDINTCFKGSSSGTTGVPIEYYSDTEGMSAGIAAGYISWGLSGWKPGDKSLHIWGNPTSIEQWNKPLSKYKRFVLNQNNLASTEFNDPGNLGRLVEYIMKLEPKAIDGYTSSIFQLANYLKQQNLKLDFVNYVFTTAENLLQNQKQTIEAHIAPVSDLYGCGEINGIGIQPIHDAKYYIIDPHVIVETELHEADFKEIIVTDLTNRAMPFIRYKIGDLIDEVRKPDDKSTFPYTYFTNVFGRSSDVIKLPNGKTLLPVNILGGTLFRKIGGIEKHKAIWDGKIMRFIFETNSAFNLELAKQLISIEFKEYELDFTIDQVDKIAASNNGKFKYFEIKNSKKEY